MNISNFTLAAMTSSAMPSASALGLGNFLAGDRKRVVAQDEKGAVVVLFGSEGRDPMFRSSVQPASFELAL